MIEPKRSLFFDLGGVLFYDEYPELFFFYQIFKGAQKIDPTVSESLFFQARETLYPRFSNGWVHVWLEEKFPLNLKDQVHTQAWEKTAAQFPLLFQPYPGALELLKYLSRKFSLYCIANQPREAQVVLEGLGFLKIFEEVFLDADTGVSKPNPCLFESALEKSQVDPKHAVFIGDRLDHDIYPAKSCGMKALQLLLPVKEVSLPLVSLTFAEAFFQSLCRFWHRNKGEGSIHSYHELVHILCS